MAENRLLGVGVSPGIASGTVVPLEASRPSRTPHADPRLEMQALHQAVATATAELEALAAAQDGDAADMLAFQVAMLADDTLSDAAYALIAQGTTADTAWTQVMDAEIALYREGNDATFATRAADLSDIFSRVLGHVVGGATATALPPGAVLVGTDITPSRFLAADWSQGGGIVLAAGSGSSHVAMLARARGVPMVVGLGAGVLGLAGAVLLDGATGQVVACPNAATRRHFTQRAHLHGVATQAAQAAALRPAVTACGVRADVLVNIGDLAELDQISPNICDGVGLTRTEFLFGAGRALPDEDTQLDAYAAVLGWAQGRPVTIRTLDAGADKPIPGLTTEHESNPFLGLRGIRLSLARPDVFRVQLRALARAAVLGQLKVMLPMVALPCELEETRALFTQVLAELAREKLAATMPELGIMVEVPAAALAIETFDAAFVSIGSNDLTQYVMAAARDIGAVSGLLDTRHQAVLRLVRMVVEGARAKNIEASLCGDAGGDPQAIPHLLASGLRVLSVAPALVGRAKLAIAATTLAQAAA